MDKRSRGYLGDNNVGSWTVMNVMTAVALPCLHVVRDIWTGS